jgi:insertion element IS1 protein InsB
MITIFSILCTQIASVLSELSKTSESAVIIEHQETAPRICSSCGSEQIIKNGSTHNHKQKYQCNVCNRQFIDNPTNISIAAETKLLIDSRSERLRQRLLLERISLRGILRVTNVSWSWLQNYVNKKMASVPYQIIIPSNINHNLIIECDEMWSFVESKKTPVYIWLAIDRHSRAIVGCFIGDRTRQSARKLWASLPAIYQSCTLAYTDFWQAYQTVIPRKSHRAVGKESGQTNQIERLNNTFRQRLSRLVRSSLSVSKKLDRHIGAIWYFIHSYNSELASV